MSAAKTPALIAGAGGGKGSNASARVAQEDPDSLRSKAYARVVDLISEGEIEGLVDGLASVYLDETPIQNPDGSTNFSGVTLESRVGTQQQSYIPGFANVENEVSVGVELKADFSVVRAISDADVDAVRIKVSIPQLTEQNTSNGDISGSSVSIAIDLQSNGSGFMEVVSDTIAGKTTTRYQRSYYLPLVGSAPWEIRVRRITEDSSSSALQNKTYVDSYTEVIESKLRYPNSALVALRVDASQFSAIPRRSYDMKLLRIRVPSNYDAPSRVYSGIWDGSFKVAWSDNPAWCFYDLVTNSRYGLGSFIPEAQVDKWALYKAARYCDELVSDGLGGYEPRFTCNLYLQTREQAYKVVQDMAAVFRGMVYWSGGAVTLSQDAPTDAVFQFTAANVIDGEFAYQGSSAKARHTVALVTWNDPEDFYRQKVEYVEDASAIARYGVVQSEVVALGCTSRAQAHRVGKWLLYSEQSESEIVTFRAGLEAAVARPGDVIKVADPVRAGMRLGGRLAQVDGQELTLDQEVPAGPDWRIAVVLPSGAIDERLVGSSSGFGVTVTLPFSETPQPGAIWVIRSSSVEPQLFRVVQVTETDGAIYEITALAHNPGKYAAIEDGVQLQPRAITVLSDQPGTPTGLAVQESLYRVKDQAQVLVQVSWAEVAAAVGYRVSYRVNGGNWEGLSTTSANYCEIRNAQEGDYEFQVRAIGLTRKEGAPATLSATVLGKTQPPSIVTGFVVLRRVTDLLIQWDEVPDADLAGYEVRVGTSWDESALVATTLGTQLVHDQSEAGQYAYHVRAIDTSGHYSDEVTTFVLNLSAPQQVRQFDVVQSANRLEFRWKPSLEPEVVGYEIREGSAWNTAAFVAQTAASSHTIPAGFSGERRFWVKAISSPGIYSDAASFVSTEVAKPVNPNLIYTQDEASTGFGGLKLHAGVVSVDSSDVLRMQSGVSRAEYLFEVDLLEPTRAQNTVLSTVGVTADDRTQWAQGLFAWGSSDAQRQWSADGSFSSVQSRLQMARADVMQPDEIEAWRLNGDLIGLAGSAVTQSHGIAYGQGRYGQGVALVDTSRLAWGVELPAVFNVTFWYVPEQVTTCVIWQAARTDISTGKAISLCVVYDATRRELMLEDHTFERLVLPLSFDAGEHLCIGVSQSESQRRLMVGGMNHTVASLAADFAPVGAMSSVQLH